MVTTTHRPIPESRLPLHVERRGSSPGVSAAAGRNSKAVAASKPAAARFRNAVLLHRTGVAQRPISRHHVLQGLALDDAAQSEARHRDAGFARLALW